MVKIKFQPLHFMASTITHDLCRQEANTLSLFRVLMPNNGRDVTRASHTSRLYPGLYAVIKTMSRMWIQLLCACVLYSYGVTWISWPYMGIVTSAWSHGRNARFWLVEKKFAALWLVSTYCSHHYYWNENEIKWILVLLVKFCYRANGLIPLQKTFTFL